MEILLSRGPFYTIGATKHENDIDQVQIFELLQTEDALGRILLGRVESVADNLQAYFIEIGHEKRALLHMKDLPKGEKLHVGELRMVQVFREATELKGARVTGLIQIKGLHCVYMPYEEGVNLSRKIPSHRQMELKSLFEGTLKDTQALGGVVVRSSAAMTKDEMLEADFNDCISLWKQYLEKAQYAQALYTFWPGGWIEWVRDQLQVEGENIIRTNRYDLLTLTEAQFKILRTRGMDIKFKYERNAFFNAYSGISDWLDGLLDRQHKLPSGGNIIVEVTEAVTVFDVNTSGSGNVPPHVTNQEAIVKVFEWLLATKTGGISIVDLIGCETESARERYFKFAKNHAKNYHGIVVHGISKLGLLELTSPNEGQSLPGRMGKAGTPSVDWVINQAVSSISEAFKPGDAYTLVVDYALWKAIREKQNQLKEIVEQENRAAKIKGEKVSLYIENNDKQSGFLLRLGSPHQSSSEQEEDWIKFSIPMDYCVDA